MKTADILGFIGVAILLIAYLLNLLNFFNENSRLYILLNILGAGIACLASVWINYIPFIVLEGVWMLVSIVALVKAINKSRL